MSEGLSGADGEEANTICLRSWKVVARTLYEVSVCQLDYLAFCHRGFRVELGLIRRCLTRLAPAITHDVPSPSQSCRFAAKADLHPQDL